MLAPRTEYWDERLGRCIGPLDPAYDAERFGALVASGSADAATTGRDTIPSSPPLPDGDTP